jgi:hypothetical protein
MVGGPPRWVWHTYEAGYGLTVRDGALALIRAGNEVHFVFNPITGQIAQLLPARLAGRGLKNAVGGVQTNRRGSVCLQVEVIARANRPWTGDLTRAGMDGLRRLVAFGRAWGIPDVWPAGPPPAYPGGSSPRNPLIWHNRAGHYGHSQVPENDHGDPGAIDTKKMFARQLSTLPERAPQDEGDAMLIVRISGYQDVYLVGGPRGVVHVRNSTELQVFTGLPQKTMSLDQARYYFGELPNTPTRRP